MINIIYGVKGSGKTKRIIDAANDRARTTKGSIIYVTDCADHSGEVDNSIRFIDINRYGIKDEEQALCFIKGLLAGNYDITDIFVDSILKVVGRDYEKLGQFFNSLDLIAKDVNLIFTVSADRQVLPESVQQYII